MLNIRTAQTFDAAALAELLNPLIAEGTTTALATPRNAADMRAWMNRAPERSNWLVAENGGDIVGFQLIAPKDDLPPEACDIASFVAAGQAGLGIGSALFEDTKKATKRLGYVWINANIRADNEPGLTYYQSRGFRDWKIVEDVQLEDGRVVSKIYKRFDL